MLLGAIFLCFVFSEEKREPLCSCLCKRKRKKKIVEDFFSKAHSPINNFFGGLRLSKWSFLMWKMYLDDFEDCGLCQMHLMAVIFCLVFDDEDEFLILS